MTWQSIIRCGLHGAWKWNGGVLEPKEEPKEEAGTRTFIDVQSTQSPVKKGQTSPTPITWHTITCRSKNPVKRAKVIYFLWRPFMTTTICFSVGDHTPNNKNSIDRSCRKPLPEVLSCEQSSESRSQLYKRMADHVTIFWLCDAFQRRNAILMSPNLS